MKKRNKNIQPVKKEEKYDTSIANQLNATLLNQLQLKKQELKQEEVLLQQKVEEEKRKERERIEKNKSFADLFNESNLDWKTFKS